MKKIFTLLFIVSMSLSTAFAGGNWASTAVSVSKDGGAAYLYLLNSEGWAKPDGNNYSGNTALNAYDFGTPTSLVLDGGAATAWADAGDYYDGTSFVVYYRVYLSTATPGAWAQFALPDPTYSSGNDRRFDKTGANIDIMALATAGGLNSYTLEVVMSKSQHYTGGSWLSMVPGGQSVGYNSLTSGYKATFVKSIATGVVQQNSTLKITSDHGKINASFEGKAKVDLFSVSGQLIRSSSIVNQFTQSVKAGAYLLRINGKIHKVLAQ